MTVTIVDYGVGNIGSIKNILRKLGENSNVASDVNILDQATKLILPGVGAFDKGMRSIEERGFRDLLDDMVLKRKIPILGICLGMQLMTYGSEEGSLSGLGWIPARTIRFRPQHDEVMKIPHMGWNTVKSAKSSSVLQFQEKDPRFYFVHSFHVCCDDNADILLTAEYGLTTFNAAFERDNIVGVQFHPEKSHKFGMALLKGFLKIQSRI